MPALAITRLPLSFAICTARLPTAPAAAETQTVSPPFSASTTCSPAYAVRPIPPSGPRCHCGSAAETSSRVSVPMPPRSGDAGSTTAKSRQPSACETVSPGTKPSAREATTSPTAMIPSMARPSGNAVK